MAAANPTVDASFIKEYESMAHIAYQRRGSHLRGTVRTKNNVQGESTTFQVIGKGTASTKSRHGKVPVMNLNHSAVEVTLTDHYAGEFVDKLDELKLNIAEMEVAAASGAYALGRKTDELIVAAVEATSNTTVFTGATLTDGMDLLNVHGGVTDLGDADVPDDGGRYWVVGWSQWGHLMQLTQFTSSDYISNRPHEGTTSAKMWNTFIFMPFSGLTDDGTNKNTLVYHKSAVGHAIGAEITTDITWQGLYAAHFVDNMMSQGAKNIDENGVYTQNIANALT